MRRFHPVLALALSALILLTPAVSPARANTEKQYGEITIERDVNIPLRDGVELSADILRPAAEGTYPTLLIPVPYINDTGACFNADPEALVRAGYSVVLNYVRGRGNSGGAIEPFINEANDGYDVVEWIARQPWSNGDVGMWGWSYCGFTQIAAASAQPPHLKAIMPYLTSGDVYQDWIWTGGAFRSEFVSTWVPGIMTFLEAFPPTKTPLNPIEHSRRYAYRWANYSGYPAHWRQHLNLDDYWKPRNADYTKINVPAFNVAGWLDIFTRGASTQYQATKRNGKEQRLLFLNIRHEQPMVANPASSTRRGYYLNPYDPLLTEETIRWFDHALKGKPLDGPPVRYQDMATGELKGAADWPIPGTEYVDYFLSADRSLARARSQDGTASYAYDATIGLARDGHFSPVYPQYALGTGRSPTFDQRVDDERSLTFETPALTETAEVTGVPIAKLFVSTSNTDADFAVKIQDVAPDGCTRFVGGGIRRLSHRNTYERSEPATAGHVYPLEVEVWPISNTFVPGHKIRVTIASADFPRSEPNPAFPAVQSIRMSKEHPSSIVLPIVPAGRTQVVGRMENPYATPAGCAK